MKDGTGEKNSPPVAKSTPPSAPLSASRKKTFLPGDLLALSGAEEGGKLILTSQGFFFFFFSFYVFQTRGRASSALRSTDLGKDLKRAVILLPPAKSCTSQWGEMPRRSRSDANPPQISSRSSLPQIQGKCHPKS